MNSIPSNSDDLSLAGEVSAGKSLGAYYSADVAAFLQESAEEILGKMAANSTFSLDISQRDAWVTQIQILKEVLQNIEGQIFCEFIVPRIGSRIDTVLITGAMIFVIEFKIGETQFSRNDINQVWDYALDLKNFHKASHTAPILPILVATEARQADIIWIEPAEDQVFPPFRANVARLRATIEMALAWARGPRLDSKVWAASPYSPTPTIIEAAQRLFAEHSVEAIIHHDAGKKNLAITSHRIEDLIGVAWKLKRKIIVFVTGVPGAGKTLVGLNIATNKRDPTHPSHAVYLSGNGPLVAVLREALTRDEYSRLKAKGDKSRKGHVAQKVKAFIQNVHHFRDAGLRERGAPSDHVVIFDEAQRAWDKDMTAAFMARRGHAEFNQSEPEFLLSYLDRHIDWAAVVCLVGGGQEINRGEAGISAWFDAIRTQFPDWHAYVSPNLTDTEYDAGQALNLLSDRQNVVADDSLHLSVSMRSFRAENVSLFVKAVLDCDTRQAQEEFRSIAERYPVFLTRDLYRAKQWIRSRARGNERFGLVASSSAHRLKPYAIDIRVDVDPVHWFLNGADDTRSSYYLEDAATEFQIQGLELDWVCVTWDADLRFVRNEWNFHSFVGSRWNSVHKTTRQQYLRNAYRVLLTRARQGMVIFVPTGEIEDPTRLPSFYDATYSYLASTGIPIL